jgi:hypothetical protein
MQVEPVEPDKSCDLCNAARMCILSAIQHTWKSSQLEIMHAGHDTQLLQGCCVAEFVFFPQGVVFNDNLRSIFLSRLVIAGNAQNAEPLSIVIYSIIIFL